MVRLNIDERLVDDLVTQMGPVVEQMTGWNLSLAGLGSRVLPRDRGYEEILLGRVRGAGFNIDENGHRTILERLIEYVVESNVLGAYEHHRNVLFVVRENVDDSNMDGLRLVVAHELVHRGQHVNYPELFDRMDRMMVEMLEGLLGGGVIHDAMAKVQEIRPVMALLETHASYIQEELRKSRFPGAVIESHFNLPVILFRLFGGQKLSQYHDETVSAAISNGSIQSLYARI
jgi:hypothetical protein